MSLKCCAISINAQENQPDLRKEVCDLLGSERLEHYKKRKAYLGERELVMLGAQEERILTPLGLPPKPYIHEGKVTGYTKWQHAHCYTVYIDLLEHRCLVVDSLKPSASGFVQKGGGKVDGSPDKPVEVNLKILGKLLNERLPLFTDGTAKAGMVAKKKLLNNCRLNHGKEDGKLENCVPASFAIANNHISSREDFNKEWEKGAKRCFFVKRKP